MTRIHVKKWFPTVLVVGVALLGLANLAAAQSNEGDGLALQAVMERTQRLRQIEQDKAGFVNDLLSQWASEAASKGYDAYWQKGQRNLLGLGADELLALSQKAKDFDTFDKLVFRGFKLNALGDLTQDLVYFPLAPCRLLDTRLGTGAFAGPKAPGTEVAFSVNDTLGPQGGLAAGCGVPSTDPPALSVVITAVPTDTGQGNLRAYPTGGTIPTASVVNYQGGVVVAGGTITQSAVTTNELTVRNQGAGTTHIVVDVTGYFARPSFGATAGTVWAAAHITGGATPTVTRAFNNIPGNTGVTVVRPLVGTYLVRFGAAITNRYYNVVLGNAASGVPITGAADVTPEAGNANGLFIRTYNAAGTATDTNFFVQIF